MIISVYAQETEPADTEPELDIEEIRRQIYNEDPAELMNMSLGDNNVSLTLKGTWKGSLMGSFGVIYSPLGMSFNSPETPFLFEQEADLLLSLWINDKWFVEASIQDDSSMNTYRAGFQGGPEDFVQYAGIGNTGLDFPVFPYLDLGGDSTSSFGFYGRVGTDNLTVHSLFRYDMASREERVFAGDRERTISYIQPDNYIRGVSFVLPKENILGNIKVYIEDEKGTIIDGRRRRWRQLLHSEFAAGTREGLLELSIRPQGLVAVSYPGINNDADEYLSNLPAVFASYLPRPEHRTVSINGDNALIIYEPGSFSPYERKNRYDAPSSTSEQADIILLSSGSIKTGYELVPLSESSASSEIPLYIQAVSQRNVYELYSKETSSRRDPKSIWPLLDEYPEIYLPVKSVYTGDTALRFTNYSGVSGYFLGTDVVKGSVQVWRSGIQDSNFIFNETSGEVVLNSSVGQNEIIRITYLRKSQEADLGSIAAGLGVIYRRGFSPLTTSLAAGVRWNITEQDAFTEEGNNSAGSAGVSGKTEWEYDNLKAHIAAGFAYEQTDTTGLYRAAGMEGHQVIMSLPADTSFISNQPGTELAIGLTDNNRADLIYKNYFNNNVLGNTLMDISWTGAVIVPGINKPYPVKDALLGNNQILAMEINLDAEKNWTGFQVPTEGISDFISRASEINIPYRVIFDSPVPFGFKLFLQIGNLSSALYPFSENTDLIWEKELDITDTPNGLHLLSFIIDEEESKKLSKANHLRIIAVSSDGTPVTGRMLLASPFIHGAAFKPINPGVIVYETIETGDLILNFPEIRRLHPDGSAPNRVLAIDWNGLGPGVSSGAEGRVGEMPLNDYRELSFFVKMPQTLAGESFNFIVSSGPENYAGNYLSVKIPVNTENFSPGVWQKITIKYQGDDKGIRVNGNPISYDELIFSPVKYTTQGNPANYTKIFIDPGNTGSLSRGSMYIDEIILEDPCVNYRINAGGAIEYTKHGAILSLNGIQALSDLKITTAVESEVRMNENSEDSDTLGSVINRSGLNFSFFGADIETNAAFTAAGIGEREKEEEVFYWSADHSISKTIEAFTVKEKFSASPYDYIANHNVSLAFSSALYTKFDADALYEMYKLRQKWEYGIGFRPENELIPAVDFLSDISYINTNTDINENDSYADLWMLSFKPLVPDAGKDANTRRSVSKFTVSQRTKPIGAILTLEGITNYTLINNLTQTENSAFLDIPITLTRSSINFRMGRGFKRFLEYSGEDIFDDGSLLFATATESAPLWKVFPGYSLFSDDLYNAMDEVSPAQYISFTDHFSTAVTLPRRSDLTSFVIPNKGTFRLERVLEQKMDTRSDVLNLGAGLGFSSVNMFGTMGYLPVFNIYQNDEFNNSIQGAVIFDEEISWRLQSVVGAGFRTHKEGMINALNTYTVKSEGYWTDSFILDWTTPAENILIDLLYKRISFAVSNQRSWPGLSALLSTDYRKLRRESIELIIDNETNHYKVTDGMSFYQWTLLFGHEEIIRVQERLEFTGFTKIKFGDDKYLETFLIELLVGVTLRVSF